jgi:hypothetical protein
MSAARFSYDEKNPPSLPLHMLTQIFSALLDTGITNCVEETARQPLVAPCRMK